MTPSLADWRELLLDPQTAPHRRILVEASAGTGKTFTLADCSGWVSLPLVGMATKSVLGEDLLAAAGIDWKSYAKLVGERPSAQKVNADRKADQAAKS